jgi:hypothetical protein
MKSLYPKSNKDTSRRYTLEQQDRYVEVMEQVQPAKKKVVPRPLFLSRGPQQNETNQISLFE